jgi:hypothetical protein
MGPTTKELHSNVGSEFRKTHFNIPKFCVTVFYTHISPLPLTLWLQQKCYMQYNSRIGKATSIGRIYMTV